MKRPRILVVGSLVMDLIVTTERFPAEGETVLGLDYTTASGGKGANQAVQAARLGAEVHMAGCVGDDDFGRAMKRSVAAAGVNIDRILTTDQACSAIGNIQLERRGASTANRIIVVSGANMCIRPEDLEWLKTEISGYDLVMLQLEISMEINELVARYAYEAGVPVMVNSAPSAPMSDEFLSHVTYLSPNEHEAKDLTGIPVTDEESAKQAAEALRSKGVQHVLITCGDRGAVMSSGDVFLQSPCIPCERVVDPTAAGDSFVGAFCTAICAGAGPEEALRFANCTAHITVSRLGAQPSMPTLPEVLQVMKEHGFDTRPFEHLQKD